MLVGVRLAYPGHLLINYVKELRDSDIQVQPAGIDLRVGKIFTFKSKGRISFKDKELPEVKEVKRREDGCWELSPGAYKIRFSEIVKIPADCVGVCLPRSSLLRSGVDLRCALWDPGYVGRGEALLTVLNPNGSLICRDARIGQLVLIKLISPPRKLYSGSYLGENINE